jgi:hypothetical protein
MKEDFLHFIWRYGQMHGARLYSTEREPLTVLHPGFRKPHAGPDFLKARILIGDTIWAGNVEIHLQAADWYRHQHQNDPRYDNIILHVVWEEDQPVTRQDGSRIPCLELKPLITPELFGRYQQLMNQPTKLPCAHALEEVSSLTWEGWLDRLAVERLEAKTERWLRELERQHFDWEQVFFQGIAYGLGLPVNGESMEQMARHTPLSIINKHRENLLQTEALIFGQAGFLDTQWQDQYPRTLRTEYHFLQHKYQLRGIQIGQWRFSRMRPANFPTIRLAQLARLLVHTRHLFGKALAAQTIRDLYHMLDLKIGQYWKDHFRFDQVARHKREKRLGKGQIQNLIINTIVPFVFLYGQRNERPALADKALRWLEELPAERNSITRFWQGYDIRAENAMHSQALLHLKRHYCSPRRCLHCAIGSAVLRSGTPPLSVRKKDS